MSVEHADLIVEQVASVGVLEEVTLQLQTDVASVAGVRAVASVEVGELRYSLRVAHESLVDRVHGVLICKWVLELSHLYAEPLEVLPLNEEVDEFRAGAEVGSVSVELHLRFPVPVFQYSSVKADAHQSEVE